jgi:hypothetical protein
MRKVPPGAAPRTDRFARWIGPLVVFGFPLLFVGRALVTGAVVAPLDLELLMEPWKSECAAQFPAFHEVQTPLLDCMTQYHPWRVYTKECLRAGELPLWDAYAFCGTPLLANQQTGVFYPPNLLFWLLPLRYAYTWSAYLALVLAGAFTWGLARELGISRSGSALSVMGFVSSGFVVAWLCYMGPVNSFLWAPLGVWMAFRYARLRDLLSLLGLALAASCTVLGGHAQAGLYALALMVAASVYVGLTPRGDQPAPPLARRVLGLVPLLGAMALGLVLAAAQVLPTLELTGLNYRTAGDTLPPRGLQLRQLNVLVAPQAHGNIAWLSDGLFPAYGFHNYVETTGYVGLVAVWLGAFAAAFATHRRRWLFAGALLASLLLAVEGPHQRMLHALLPPLRQMSNVGRAVCLYGLTLPVLAGWGLDRLRSYPWADDKARSRALGLSVCVLLACVLALSASWTRLAVAEEQFAPGAALERQVGPIRASLIAGVVFALAPAGLLALARRGAGGRLLAGGALALALADAAVFAWGFHPAVDARLVDAQPPTLTWLREQTGGSYRILTLPTPGAPPLSQLLPNLPTLARVRDVRGYDSLYPRTAAEVLAKLDPDQPTGLLAGARGELADRLGVRYVVRRGGPASDLWRRLEPTARPLVSENRGAWPIAFTTTDAGLPASADGLEPADVTWRANSRRIRAGAGRQAWLCETAYGGWHAYTEGRETPLSASPPDHKGARVGPSGTVDLVYEPGSFAVGLFVALCALALATGGLAGHWAMGRRGPRDAEG